MPIFTMKAKVKGMMMSVTLAIMFGFILFGGGSSFGGFSSGIVASNKFFAPSIFPMGGASASFGFFAAPRPVFANPVNFNAAGAFRWNFFDP